MTPSLSLQARRELTRQYKQAFPAMGIYALRCNAAGLLRVGSSRHLDGIFNRLRFELMRGAHRDRALQTAWNTHGVEAFRFEVVDRVKERDDPAFDYDAELATLLALWEAELLSPAAEGGARQGGGA